MTNPKFKVGDKVLAKFSPYSKATILEIDYDVIVVKTEMGKECSWLMHDVELCEPAAPFTREEIDALIDAYPDCNCLAFSEKNRNKTYLKDYSNLESFSDKKPYLHKGRKIGFEWDEDLTDNQIRVCIGYDTNLATWTKGDPLPGEVEPWTQKECEAYDDYLDETCSDWSPTVPLRPKTQTTHTFTAELPSGEVVEMPAPDGDGWTQVEREEFKRGDRRWISYDPNPDIRTIYQAKTHDVEDNDQTFWYCNIEENSACWASEMLQENTPILSITTWRREIQPDPPEEEPYDYDCISNDKVHRADVESQWPERDSEVE
jgi:hypothetical protein